jgi:DNA-binding CsgD family transcriptional regulator
MAVAHLGLGDREAALATVDALLEQCALLDHRSEKLWWAVDSLAACLARDDPARAARLLGFVAHAQTLRLASPLYHIELEQHEAAVEDCRARLGEAAYEAALAEARAVPIADAIAEVLAAGARRRPRDPHARELELTARELEVLQLLARGMTNAQIGKALFISPHTTAVHVSRILGKLGVANRGEAAAYARDRGLAGVAG